MSEINKTLLVTGGSKGIGRAIIEKFAHHNFELITCARNEQKLLELKKYINQNYNCDLKYCVTDLSNIKGIQKLMQFVDGKIVDVLINNCGKFVPGLVHEEDEGILESMINTNLYSAYHLSRFVVSQMKKRKSGHIFNICSVASLQAYVNGGSYSISKFALYGLTKALREELKKYGIKVTAVLPGAVLTDSWEGTNLPEERFIHSMDIAEAIFNTYNLSDRAVVEDLLIRPQEGDI